MFLDLLHPIVYVVKGISVIYSICHNDSHCTFIIGLGDGSESLLTRSVPDLHLDLFPFDFNGLDLKINTCKEERF